MSHASDVSKWDQLHGDSYVKKSTKNHDLSRDEYEFKKNPKEYTF